MIVVYTVSTCCSSKRDAIILERGGCRQGGRKGKGYWRSNEARERKGSRGGEEQGDMREKKEFREGGERYST